MNHFFGLPQLFDSRAGRWLPSRNSKPVAKWSNPPGFDYLLKGLAFCCTEPALCCASQHTACTIPSYFCTGVRIIWLHKTLHNMYGLHRAGMLLRRSVLQYGCIGPAITLHKACHCEAYCVTGLVSKKTKLQAQSAARMQAQCSQHAGPVRLACRPSAARM